MNTGKTDGVFQGPDPTLVAPRIPVVDQTNKGGLGVDELRSNPPVPVQVIASISSGMKVNDTAILYWNADLVSSFLINDTHVSMGILNFPVDQTKIPDSNSVVQPDIKAEVHYESYTVVGQNHSVSFPYFVLVNTQVPGDPIRPSPEPINNKLAAPGGIPDPVTDAIAVIGVDVNIPVWLNMEVGDVLTLTWGQTKLIQPPLTEADRNKPVIIHVDEGVILATPNTLRLKVFYDIRDNVGNWSLLSPPAITDIEAGPNTLPAPSVVDAVDDDDIDLAELGTADARVDIPVYTGWSSGDAVILYWFGTTMGGVEVNETVSYTMKDTDQGFAVRLKITNASVVAIAQGHAIVYYEVNSVRRSRRVQITVSGAVQKLPAPTVVEQQGGVLDPVLVPASGATVIVTFSPGMATGDDVYLYWNGVTSDGSDTHYTDNKKVGQVGQDVTFTVPKVQVDALAGGSLDVYYTVVSDAGIPRESEHLPLGVADVQMPLPMPTVDNALGDVLDPDVYDRTVVHIDGVGARLKLNDDVTAYWTGDSLPGSSRQDFRVSSDNQMLSWNILPPLVEVNRNATVAVRYAVTRVATGGQENSEVRTLQIRPTLIETLPEPTFPHATLFGYLNCCSVPRIWEGITVSIESHPSFSAGDSIELAWQGCDSLNGTSPIPGANATFYKTLTATDAVNGFEMVVLPFENLIEPMVNNGSGTARYRLYKGGTLVGQSRLDFVKINRTQPSGEVCSPLNDICET